MSPIQQMLLGAGAVDTKTYVDDVFSTYLFTGNAGTQAINNGIDLAGEGGLVWTKNRDSAFNHFLYDTERGVQKYLISDSNIDEQDVSTSLTAFNSNGFTLGANDYGNITNGNKATSWTFRKSPAFTIKEYSGTGSSQAISHDLGSMPGLIIVKLTSSSGGDWTVWQRDLGTEPELGQQKYLMLNRTNVAFGNAAKFSAAPTATTFSVGTSNDVNGNGNTYIAYIFAGGESTAATARSVDFDGTGDFLWLNTDTDLTFGTGAFTIEFWFKVTSNNTHQTFIADWEDENYQIEINTDGKCQFAWGANSTSYWSIVGSKKVSVGTWNHIAVVRNGNVFTQYLNGIFDGSFTSSTSANTNALTRIGKNVNASTRYLTGQISNLRIVKGTAVYTSSFRPPTEPLTNITNTVLLCCNNSSITGATVTPGTLSLTSGGNPTASTDSPFDDPAGFVFGDAEDQDVIKCGSYIGNNSNDGPHITLGFEPQFLMVKCSTANENWEMYDNMRGVVDDSVNNDDAYLKPNANSSETLNNRLRFTSTGFQPTTASGVINDPQTYIYIAIRRPDGYVGKPPELGTDVFAMSTIQSSDPRFVSNFPVDFLTLKLPASVQGWYTSARLIQGRNVMLNETSA